MRNRIAAVEGDEQIDVEQYSHSARFYREVEENKAYRLEEQLESLTASYERAVEQKRLSDARAAYYVTPEGAAHKARLEEAIEKKIAEWAESDRRTAEAIETRIRQLMGTHWGVERLDKGYLKIGIIDAAKSTAERREFFFGQEIEIRYEEHNFFEGKERFDSDCCTAGCYSMLGGHTVGERAMFYVGVGKLYGDAQTVEWLRIAMRDYNRAFERYGKEIDALHTELNNPLKREEAQ